MVIHEEDVHTPSIKSKKGETKELPAQYMSMVRNRAKKPLKRKI
jgi:hypothetical protein